MRISDCSSDVCSSDLLRFDRAPRIFQVNWFRKGTDGRFLWPGFGENSRVIDWIIRRVAGQAGAVETPIGRISRVEDLNLHGIPVAPTDLDQLLAGDPAYERNGRVEGTGGTRA